MKTAIVVDSGSNIYNETIEKDGLFSVPLQLTYEGNSYKESIEITNEQVNTLMQDGVLIQTSLPSLGEISDLFEQIKKDGYDQIFAVPITSGLSSTLGAMKTAAQLVDIPFDYIDCFTTMHIQLLAALRAHDLFTQGKTNDEVKKNLNEMIDRSETIIIPDNLDHLSKGGRLSPLAAKLGGLLRIKPILHLNRETKGVIEALDKVRTMTRAIDEVIKRMKKAGVDEHYQITFTHVMAEKEAAQTIEKMKETFPQTKIVERDLITTVSAHVGIGAIAFQYIYLG